VFVNFRFRRLFDRFAAGMHVVHDFADAACKAGLFVDDLDVAVSVAVDEFHEVALKLFLGAP
jgi:hypothetical protein